jgi:hypothetical protein
MFCIRMFFASRTFFSPVVMYFEHYVSEHYVSEHYVSEHDVSRTVIMWVYRSGAINIVRLGQAEITSDTDGDRSQIKQICPSFYTN